LLSIQNHKVVDTTAVRRNVFVVSAALFLFFAPFTASIALRNFSLGLAAAALAFLAARGELVVARPVPRALVGAALAWSALAAASLAWSANFAYTLNELRSQIGYPAVAAAVFYCGTNGPPRWRVWWLTLLVGTLAVFAAESVRHIASPALGLREWHGGVGAFSTHLAIVAPLALAMAWPAPWGAARGPLALAAALAIVFSAAWDTGNRIVWAAFFASLAVALVSRRVATAGPAQRNGSLRVTLAALVAIVVLFAATAWQRDGLFPREEPRTSASLQADLRPKIWAAGLQEWRKAPWLGQGFGREIAADALRPLTPRGGGHPEVQHAHNLFLNVALQLGAAGLAIFSAMLVLAAREFAASLRDPATAPAGILGLAVLAGFVVKNLTDDFMHRHNALVFWAVLAALLALSRPRRPAP
jgi:O-antigen ligase